MKMKLELHPRIIRSYKRLPYKAWYALAEFIDNSTQSWYDNRDVLKQDSGFLKIGITLENEFLRITDTAMGMDFDDLKQALRLGVPPVNTNGRSEYGLGMKTAACWFGDLWRIKTKKRGSLTEYEVEIDVEKIADDNLDLKTIERKKPKSKINDHYTVIEIERLHRYIHHRTIRRLKEHIKSMYRVDIRGAELWVSINGEEELDEWTFGDEFLKASNGQPYKKEFEHVLSNGKKIRGWLGVLAKGSGGRRKGGIAIIRRGRVILGQPNAWKPNEIYGDSRNDLINQRLVGEIFLDDFDVSHTKDDIQWKGREEVDIGEYLHETFQEYRRVANTPYKDIEKENEELTSMEIDTGLQELKDVLESPRFSDLLELEEVPPPEMIDAHNNPMKETVQYLDPNTVVKVGEKVVKIFLNSDVSPNDPYYIADWPGEELIININTRHRHWIRIVKDVSSFYLYVLDCVFDGLAEWKAAQKTASIHHDTFKFLKDGFLRQSFEDFSEPEEAFSQNE